MEYRHQLPFDSNNSRQIITYKDNAGIPFQWSNLSADQQTSLGNSAKLDYLRGKNDTTYRSREHVLGDIINSSPVYVGAPSLIYPNKAPFGDNGARYNDFWNTNKTRKPIVYVGANDGMLHAFRVNADGANAAGSELFAYVPNAIFSKLTHLTDPAYNHEYFVDQTPTVSDAFFNQKHLPPPPPPPKPVGTPC